MAKKKNQNRKHKFKYTEPASKSASGNQETGQSQTALVTPVPKSVVLPRPLLSTRDFSYVSRDVAKIVILATFLIILELILRFVLGNTPLGKAIYSLIQL